MNTEDAPRNIQAIELTPEDLRQWATVPVGLDRRTVYLVKYSVRTSGSGVRVMVHGPALADTYDLPARAKITLKRSN